MDIPLGKFGITFAPGGSNGISIYATDANRLHIQLQLNKRGYYYNVENIPGGVEYYVKDVGLTQFNLWDAYSGCDSDISVIRQIGGDFG